ncbi:MAG TPA: vitamin K epoxide reductase family protein [Acidimicrobiales bacterium]
MSTDLGRASRETGGDYDIPRWAVITTFALSLLGLGLSIYLTIEHFQPVFQGCVANSVIDCQKVTTSGPSHFLGVPVAFLGLGNYVVMSALTSPWAWRARERWIHVARFILAIVSMGFVLWLVYAEVEIIDAICLYCTGVHVVTFALLLVLTRVSPEQLGWGRSRAR